MSAGRLMTPDELRRHLKLDDLLAAGYTVEIRHATIQEQSPESYSFEICWMEYPLEPVPPPDAT